MGVTGFKNVGFSETPHSFRGSSSNNPGRLADSVVAYLPLQSASRIHSSNLTAGLSKPPLKSRSLSLSLSINTHLDPFAIWSRVC